MSGIIAPQVLVERHFDEYAARNILRIAAPGDARLRSPDRLLQTGDKPLPAERLSIKHPTIVAARDSLS
jgi:hypothetical protein